MTTKRLLAVLLSALLLMGVCALGPGISASADSSVVGTPFLKYTGSVADAPAGLWAFYVQGNTGGGNGGAPGKIWGIYASDGTNGFTVGTAPGGIKQGSGSAGGAGTILVNGSTLIAVAGGGGGQGPAGRGGDAGWAAGYNGGNGTALFGTGNAGGNNANQQGRNGSSGGGGTGATGGQGGDYGCPASGGGGQDGSYLQGGAGGSISPGYNTGGGGGGYFGGGGGGPASTSGAGGGGSSMTLANSGVPSAYANPNTYYEHAVNYFWSEVQQTDGAVLLVYLGMSPTAVCATFIDYDGANQETRTVFCEAGTTISPLQQRTYTGWTPIGWAKDDTAANAAPTSNFTINQNTTFYGLYEGQTYTLDYKVRGLPRPDLQQVGQSRANSANIAAFTNPTCVLHTITDPDYDFDGWIDSYAPENEYPGGYSLVLTKNTTLIANLNTRSHTVTYNRTANGGTGPNTYATVYEGSPVDVTTPTASKPGWIFVGWNTNQNATTALASLAMPKTDVTLYAIYKPISVTGVYFTLEHSLNYLPDARAYRWLKANIEPSNATNQNVAWTNLLLTPGLVDIVYDTNDPLMQNDPLIRLLKIKDIAGVEYIKATTQDGSHEAFCKVESTAGSVKLTFTGPEETMGANAQLQLEAAMIVAGAGNGDVDWNSDNTKVATVDDTGLVKAHEDGKATITGTIDLDESSSVVAEFAVTVGDGIEKGGNNNNNNNNTQLKWWQKLPPWLQWILRWFCFGWIWMK